MGYYLYVVLGYLLVLAGFNLYRSRKVQSQEDFMVAGRKLSLTTMVFTLICTWIGSGTFIAGAEYAARAGWSALWLSAGAWVGIAIIYFLAARIRTFGQYTVGDILEVRYGKWARLVGAVALIIAFTTIVSYQFRAGGFILNVATNGAISVEAGQAIAAGFVILFTAIGGMVAVAHTDLPNGIIILVACCAALPLAIGVAGGLDGPSATLPAQHFAVFAEDFGQYPALKAGGYFLATLMLLLGIQSMYQKFYSAKSPTEARRAVGLWIVGTVVVETIVVVIAIYSASAHWAEIRAFDVAATVKEQVATGALAPSDAERTALAIVAGKDGKLHAADLPKAEGLLRDAFSTTHSAEEVAAVRVGMDPGSVVLRAAEDVTRQGTLGLLVGLLLLGAACAVVISTGMNYLLSPTTNIIRDIYQRFLRPDADPAHMVALQKVLIVVVGLCAFLMIFVPTVLGSSISVLRYSYFAYTMYGVSITPALIAALAWKRATRAGGLASIISGATMALLLELVVPNAFPSWIVGGDPAGIPSIFPAALVSIGTLVIVSLLTPPPSKEELEPLFGVAPGALQTKEPAA